MLRRWIDLSRSVVSPGPGLCPLGPKQYICFFDGGSRGNPGSGGAGSVVVEVDRITRTAAVVWYGAMAYGGRRTRNNVAEYWGLIPGLQQAATAGYRPLHVVGDSSLILNQVRLNRRPKAAHLVALHRVATRLSAEVGVVSWKHHLQAHNKMADAAANIAMDDTTSYQSRASDGRPELSLIVPYLDSDVQHWISRTVLA